MSALQLWFMASIIAPDNYFYRRHNRCLFPPIDAAKECETKSKRLLCAKVVPTGNVCKVPANVDKIINVTVKQTMGDTVCNKAAFPLETAATQAYTWHGDEIYRSDDCSAVFNVEYEKCKIGEPFMLLIYVINLCY